MSPWIKWMLPAITTKYNGITSCGWLSIFPWYKELLTDSWLKYVLPDTPTLCNDYRTDRVIITDTTCINSGPAVHSAISDCSSNWLLATINAEVSIRISCASDGHGYIVIISFHLGWSLNNSFDMVCIESSR